MYGALLFFHSWIRWGVVALAGLCLLRFLVAWRRGEEWGSGHDQWLWAYGWVVTSQFFVGFTLYLVSPLPRAAFVMGRGAMQDPVLRFFAIEHPVLMVLAFLLSVLGILGLYRGAPELRARRAMFLFLVVFALVMAGIPWPGSEKGRPLGRELLI